MKDEVHDFAVILRTGDGFYRTDGNFPSKIAAMSAIEEKVKAGHFVAGDEFLIHDRKESYGVAKFGTVVPPEKPIFKVNWRG